jgi:hypothetical protein
MKHLFLFSILLAAVFVFWGCQETISPELEESSSIPMVEGTGNGGYEPPDKPGCVRTPGYWKNNTDWVQMRPIFMGDAENVLKTLWIPNNKDKWLTLYRAYVAALLNKHINGANTECVDGVITEARDWLFNNKKMRPIGAGGKKSPWRGGEMLYLILDDYNNGKMCESHCD